MKSIVKGVHVNLTAGLKDHVQEHLIGPLERFYDDEAAEVEVHLRDSNGPKGGEDKECSVTVRMPGSTGIHVTEVSDNLYKSIDLSRDRLERAIKRELAKKREGNGHTLRHSSSRPVAPAYEGTTAYEEGTTLADIDGLGPTGQ